MFKRFRAKVSAGTFYDERSETESSDPEIRKAIKSIVLTKGEKEEISGRFQDTSKMVFKELVQDVPSSFRELEKSTYTEGYLMFGTTKSMKIYSCNGNKPVLLSTENNQLSKKDDVSRKKRVRNAQNLPKTQQALTTPDSGDMLRLTNPNNTTKAKTETKTKLPVSHSNSMTPVSKEGHGQENITSAATNTNNNTCTTTTTTGGSRGSNFCRIS